MGLSFVPESVEAKSLTEALSVEVWDGKGTRSSPSSEFRQAMGAVIGVLLQAADHDRKAYVFRPKGKDRFRFESIGYRGFTRAVERLEQEGYLSIRRGGDRGNASKFRAKSKLLMLAAAKGVEPNRWSAHFGELPRPKSLDRPIVVKSSSQWEFGKKFGKVVRYKRRGATLPVDLTKSPAVELGLQVNEINEFFASARIDPPGSHWVFQRIFNQGEAPAYGWDKGGRLYSLGGNYQNIEKEKRSLIEINGEKTIEVDLQASHLTILRALRGVKFDPAVDPYVMPGLPRFVVKRWVTMTLGHDRFQRCWSADAKEDYREEKLGTGNLQKDYPINTTRETILKHLPVLADWEACPVRWGDLQYLESKVIVDAVHELATHHHIPALPLHDSLIVPAGNEAITRTVLEDCFERHIGVKPMLAVK